MEKEVLCRACLSLSTNFHSIFEVMPGLPVKISEVLANFSIQVEDSYLPMDFCWNCLEDMKAGYRFLETFRRSQDVLIQRVKEDCNEENSVQILFCEDTDDSTPVDSVVATCGENASEEDLLIQQSVTLTSLYNKRNYLEESEMQELLNNNDSDVEDVIITIEGKNVTNSKSTSLQSFQCSSEKLGSKLPCPVCRQSFKKISFMRVHLEKKHNTEKTLFCGECLLHFNSIDYFIDHCNTIHRYQCKTCFKSYPTGDTYQRHIQTHTKSLPKFACPFEGCSKIYTTKHSLEYHVTSFHSESKKFLCNLCGMSFKTCDNLRYHFKKHNGPSFACKYCDKSYFLAGHLRAHMWRHTGVKPFKCNDCEKTFVNKMLMKKHMARSCINRANLV